MKSMKARRILCTLLVLFVCVAAMATKANAANVSGDWEYTLSEGNAVITAYRGSGTKVTVPSEIDGLSVVGIGNGVFQDHYDLVSVTLPSNLRSIGQYAFSGCTSLTSITLPKKLENVGYHAFYNTQRLEKITVNSVKLSDFSNNDTYYNAGKEVEGGVAVEFSDAVTRIPAKMFAVSSGDYYNRIKSVKIGKAVTYIGDYAFAACYDLKTVTIPSDSALMTIDQYAFSGCTGLTSITLPRKLENVGYHAFYNTQRLEKITVNSVKLSDFSNNDTFYNAGKEVEDGITVKFSNAVTRIPSYMFDGTYDNCPNINKVSIGKGVTYIGYAAFRNCPSIRSISFASGSKVSKIDGYAFEDCDRVTSIVLPNTVTEIGSYAFTYCDNLSTIRFSGNCPKINSYAFNQVTANAYYPKSDATWTSDKLANYGGTITWKSYTPVKISTQPKTGYAKNGETVEVTVKAKGEGLKYQWYIKNDGASKYSKSSITKATYSCKMNEDTKDRRVYCVITDKFGNSVQSKTVMLRMEASIVTQPKNTYTQSGSTAKVTVKAMGDELTYTWYIKNAGASKYSKSSVTKSTYSCKMNDASKDRYVYCVVEDEYGNTVKSKTVVLRMAATITKQPKSVTVEEGEKAKVTVKAVGDGLTYQWYIKNPGKDSYSKSSVTSATYSCKMTDAADGRRVYCVVTDAYGKTAKSNTVTLSME